MKTIGYVLFRDGNLLNKKNQWEGIPYGQEVEFVIHEMSIKEARSLVPPPTHYIPAESQNGVTILLSEMREL